MATATGTDQSAELTRRIATTSSARPASTRPVSIRAANIARNAAGGTWARRRRWRQAREACWALLGSHVAQGARVAIVGAGNGDDLPLARLARRAGTIDLIDLDERAIKRARRRCAMTRTPVRLLVEDVSGGATDRIIQRAVGRGTDSVTPPVTPIGDGPYDVVIADLLATQMLYPALLDSGLPAAQIDATLLAQGQRLTEAVTARMHAATPTGVVIHLHDMLGWWAGHEQPFSLEVALALAGSDPAATLTLAARANAPHGCDPRAASLSLGAQIVDTRFWRWPFAPGVDYLVCASVARTPAAILTPHPEETRAATTIWPAQDAAQVARPGR